MDFVACRTTLITSLLCLFLSFVPCVQAQVPVENKIVTGQSYFPYITDALPHGGWSRAIVNAVFAHLGRDMETDIVPWSRGYQWALENKYLGAFPYVYSEQRNREFLYSDPINMVPIRIYVYAKSQYFSVKSLANKTLCLPHGYVLDPQSERTFSNLNIVIVRSQDAKSCAKHIELGRSDFGLMNGYFLESSIIAQFGALDNIRLLEQDLGDVALHFIISRSFPKAEQHLRAFNSALKQINENGVRAKIDHQFQTLLKGSRIQSSSTINPK